MTFLSKQEIFDISSKHLLAQGVKAVDDVNGYCMYRGPKGTKCAVGVLIADEVYNAEIENISVGDLFCLNRNILEGSGIDPDSQEIENLLYKLQHIHDHVDCDTWRISLAILASQQGLVFNMKG